MQIVFSLFSLFIFFGCTVKSQELILIEKEIEKKEEILEKTQLEIKELRLKRESHRLKKVNEKIAKNEQSLKEIEEELYVRESQQKVYKAVLKALYHQRETIKLLDEVKDFNND